MLLHKYFAMTPWLCHTDQYNGFEWFYNGQVKVWIGRTLPWSPFAFIRYFGWFCFNIWWSISELVNIWMCLTIMFWSTFASSYHQMFLISKSSRSSFARICSTYFHHTRVCTHHIGIRMHLFNRTALWHSLSRCSYKVQAAWSTRMTTLTTASLARSSAGKARWPDLR